MAGNCADDPLYIPAIERVRATLSNRGFLYIGDCKMAAIATRAHLAAGNDYYLPNQEAIKKKISLFGWRVYATNHPEESLSLADGVVAYRDEYLMERGFGRFKGFPLSLTPIYLQREDHIKGLIRLLSIALRVLTLLEFQVRRHLADKKQKLSGLYAGNPKRTTNRPTAEQLLSAFKEINRVSVTVESQASSQIEQLSPLQQEILNILEIPTEIYTQLGQ